MSKRVLFILPRIPYPPRDGAEVVISQTLESLRKQGTNVDVFSLNPSRQHRQSNELTSRVPSSHVSNIDSDIAPLRLLIELLSSPVYQIGEQKLSTSYWTSRFIDLNAARELVEFVSINGPYDVVHCETLFTVFYGLYLRDNNPWKERTIRVVYRSHNVEWKIQDDLAASSHANLLNRYVRLRLAQQTMKYEIAVANLCDGIVCISERDAEWYRQNSRANVVSLLPGIAVTEPSGSVQIDLSIGFLGSLDWKPNAEGLAWFVKDVFPLIRQAVPGVTLSVAGRSSARYRNRWDDADIQIIGEVPSAVDFIARHTVMVAPVFSGSGIRIKLLEAFACGSVVVTTSKGAEGLGIENQRECFVADTPELFASCCIRALTTADDRKLVGNNAIQFVQTHHSWSTNCKMLTAFYESII